MTNAQIITSARFSLMEQGVIGSTGRMIEIEDENGKRTVPEPEEIHTYQAWKQLGYQVKKGQKAIAAFTIWKHTSKENKETDEKEDKMFMKNAHFFKPSQVEAIA